MIKVLLTISLLLVYYPFPLFASNFTVDTIKINSKILNEERTLLVYEPSVLNKADSVSLIYLLDGEFSSFRYNAISKENCGKSLIGIGIINTDRRRDMLPPKQPDKFLKFISEELFPQIEKEYLVKQRILFGHSFAGGFTIFAMINSPGLFDKYIASSPTPIMNMVDSDIYNKLNQVLTKPIKFYFSYGSKDMGQVKKWAAKLNDNLQVSKLTHINWKREIFEGENHNTSDLFALKRGIEY